MLGMIFLASALCAGKGMVWEGTDLAAWTNAMTSVRQASLQTDGLCLETADWRGLGLAFALDGKKAYDTTHELRFRAKAAAPSTGQPCVRARVLVRYEGERDFGKQSGEAFLWTIDGKWHDYAVRPFRDANGRKAVGLKLGLPPECRNSGTVTIQRIAFRAHPVAPTFTVMGVQRDGWCEPGSDRVECRVRVWNRGTSEARNVSVDDLPLREEMAWLEKPAVAPIIPSDGTHTFRGWVKAPELRQRQRAREAYVPEPKPPKTDYEIAACYFPGWMTADRWRVIERSCPERKPLLGWYDEANPEVVDWQIKYLSEHGIGVVMLDWYWLQGEIRLGHWLDAYRRAKWRKYLKWFVMWCNESQKPIHTSADNARVTQYWIDHYFTMPEYHRTNGKPTVGIFVPEHYLRDFGSEGKVREMLEASRAMARAAGHGGIHFIGYLHPVDDRSADLVDRWKRCGFDEIAAYNYYGHHGAAESCRRYDFEHVVQTSAADWESRVKNYSLPFWPCISSGRDERPWVNRCEVYNRTVAGFRRICEDIKAMADHQGMKRIQLGPLNEWGEGSYLEPNREYGFGMYDAVRDVFCEKPAEGWPENLVPADLGLGPYDIPSTARDPQAGDRIDFTLGEDRGFKPLSGMGVHCSTVEVSRAEGLRVVAKTATPAVVGEFEPFDPARYQSLQIKLKTSAKRGNLRVYWRAEDLAWCEAASTSVKLVADGQWHVYTLDFANRPAWRQRIYALRIQPDARPGDEYAVQWLHVCPACP